MKVKPRRICCFRSTRPSVCRVVRSLYAVLEIIAIITHTDTDIHSRTHTLTHTGMSRCVAVLTCGKEQTKRTTAAVQKQQQDQNETAKEKMMKKKKKLAKNMFKTFSSTLHLRWHHAVPRLHLRAHLNCACFHFLVFLLFFKFLICYCCTCCLLPLL